MTLSFYKLYSVGDRMINEYEAVGGMRITKGHHSISRKPAPVSFPSPQILHDLNLDGILVKAMRNLWLIAPSDEIA
jgi:hypothetical protein